MLTFNREKAKAAGFTDTQISAYLAQNQPAATTAMPAPQSRATPGIVNWLPLLGSLLGGFAGAPLGPAGLIGGSAIGGGLGETGRQLFGGGELQGGKILGEAALGGLGGGLGVLFGGATKAARAAQAAEEAGGNVLTRTGAKVAAGPYVSKGISKLAAKGTRNIASKALAIGETAAELPARTAPGKLTQLGTARGALNKLLEKVTSSAGAKAAPVSGKELLSLVKNEAAASAVDLGSGTGKTALKFWGPQIEKVANVSELGQLNEKLLVKLQGLSTKSEQGVVLQALQNPIGNAFKTASGTGELYGQLSRLNAAEPIIGAQAAQQWYGPLGIRSGIPTRLGEYLGSTTGRGLTGAGGLLERGGAPLRIGAGQVAGRAIGGPLGLGGGGEATQGYVPQPQEGITAGYTQPEQPGFNITAEQAALAQLMLPPKQADAIMAAYKLLNPSGATSASQEFIDKALNTMSQAFNLDAAGFGPIKGGLYKLQISQTGGSGVPSDVVRLNQIYTILKLNVLRAYQGARISDADYRLAQEYIPTISDTDATARTKLQVLNQLLLTAPAPTGARTSTTYQQTD